MSRSSARELVFKLVFEYLFNKEKDTLLFEEFVSSTKFIFSRFLAIKFVRTNLSVLLGVE